MFGFRIFFSFRWIENRLLIRLKINEKKKEGHGILQRHLSLIRQQWTPCTVKLDHQNVFFRIIITIFFSNRR